MKIQQIFLTIWERQENQYRYKKNWQSCLRYYPLREGNTPKMWRIQNFQHFKQIILLMIDLLLFFDEFGFFFLLIKQDLLFLSESSLSLVVKILFFLKVMNCKAWSRNCEVPFWAMVDRRHPPKSGFAPNLQKLPARKKKQRRDWILVSNCFESSLIDFSTMVLSVEEYIRSLKAQLIFQDETIFDIVTEFTEVGRHEDNARILANGKPIVPMEKMNEKQQKKMSFVSKKHFSIMFDLQTKSFILLNDSKNLLVLNGKEVVADSAALENGSTIHIADNQFVFKFVLGTAWNPKSYDSKQSKSLCFN